MHKILLIGNPNVGKSTLFNSLTKSNAHTGNFHGVTVEEKRKIVTFNNQEYEFVDLPGIYSLNTFSYEEDVSKQIILNENSTRLLIVDANSLTRNLYLALQLKELNLNFKILINNYDYFFKKGNSLNIEKLKKIFKKDIEIVNAKKCKLTKNLLTTENNNNQQNNKKFLKNEKNEPFFQKKLQNNSENLLNLKNFSNFSKNSNKETNENNFSFEQNLEDFSYLKKFILEIKSKFNLSNEQIVFAFNGVYKNLKTEEIAYIKNLLPQVVQARYNYLNEIVNSTLTIKKDYVYGYCKADKFLLNPLVMIVGFFAFFFASIYTIFFAIGPIIANWLNTAFNFLVVNPIMNLLYTTTSNVWLIEFFSSGVFNSFTTIITFLPQVCLLFIFLTILEDSGIISRMAYVLDDFLTKFGLNGKSIYIILMGLGCNTMSTLASRNANSKNLKIKTALINPYISCMARLPIYVIVASAFFGKKSYFVIVGLYLLGLAVALTTSAILNKTILKNSDNNLLLEFPPLRHLDVKHLYSVGKTNAIDFVRRVFGVVLSVGVIVWILTHTNFSFKYTQTMTDSILFFFAQKIAFLFAPIGLNSAGVVCALFVGIMAKELIVSTLSISNNAASTTTLISSLTLASSVVHFNTASAVSFLIFTLLYCPCISNLAVLKKEVGKFYMWFAIICQLTTAYLLSFVFYQGITNGIIVPIITLAVAILIISCVIYIIKKVKHPKCLTCNKCRK